MHVLQYILAFALVFSAYGQTTTLSPTITTCENVVDIVFALDESGSLSSDQFIAHRNLIRYIAAMYDLDDKTVARVGVFKFDNNITDEFAVGDYINKGDALAKIAAMPKTGMGATATSLALNHAWQLLVNSKNNQPNLPERSPTQLTSMKRIIILLSDGKTTFDPDTTTPHPCAPDLSPNPPPFDQAACNAHVEAQAARIKEGTYSGNRNNVAVVGNSLLGPTNIFVGFVNNPDTAADQAHLQNIASTPLTRWFRDFMNGLPTTQSEVVVIAMDIVSSICCSDAPTSSPTASSGDIHFQTLDGVMYTFNGAGDYVYLNAEGKLDIHIRAAMVGKATTLAAMALKDAYTQDTIELWWNGIGADALHVNLREKGGLKNREMEVREDAIKIGPFLVWRNELNKQILLQHQTWTNFNITANYGGRASFGANVPDDWKTAGLGGNNNGAKADDICDRKGKCVGLDATNREVHQAALDWKALPDELLFEKWMPVNDWELRYHPLEMTYEELVKARQLCGEIQQCIFDYVSVGKKEYALLTRKDYLAFQKAHKHYVYIGDRL